MFCAKCGSSIPQGVDFCPNCGASCHLNSNNQPKSNKNNIKKIIAILFILIGVCSIICGIVVMCTSDSSNGHSRYGGFFEHPNDTLEDIANNTYGINENIGEVNGHLYAGNFTIALGFGLILIVAGAVLIVHGIDKYTDVKN